MRLNFGCGYDIKPDWVNVDKVRHGKHDVADILSRWPYSDNVFNEILTAHVLHMFDRQELRRVLEILHSNLKPGCPIYIEDFDPIKAFEAYQRGDAAALVIPDDVEPTLDGKFANYLSWYGTRHSLNTGRGMAELLMQVGFKNAAVVEPFEYATRPEESYYVMGVK